jgi:hypothetical protein
MHSAHVHLSNSRLRTLRSQPFTWVDHLPDFRCTAPILCVGLPSVQGTVQRDERCVDQILQQCCCFFAADNAMALLPYVVRHAYAASAPSEAAIDVSATTLAVVHLQLRCPHCCQMRGGLPVQQQGGVQKHAPVRIARQRCIALSQKRKVVC